MLLAIDPGTNSLGWAVFNDQEELLAAGSIQPKTKNSDRKTRSIEIIDQLIMENLRLFSINTPISVVALEEPMLRGLSNNAMQRILGMIEYVLQSKKIIYYSPMAVKASMGSGKFDKADMYNAANDLLNMDLVRILKDDDDAIDAICIGLTHFKKEAGRVNNDSKQLSNPSKKAPKKRKGKAKSRVRGCQKRTSTHKKKRK